MSKTPRTDAERAKTLNPAYEHVGAEEEAWECSRKREEEAVYWQERCLLAEDYISESPCDPDIYEDQLKAYWLWMDFKKEPIPFSGLW